jgi:hypothetical protein
MFRPVFKNYIYYVLIIFQAGCMSRETASFKFEKKDQAIEYHNNGKLRMGVSSQSQVVAGIEILKGVFVYFDENGKLDAVGFNEKHTFNGLEFAPGGFTSFYDSGNGKNAAIKSGRLDHDQVFGEFHLKGGSDVQFNDSGKLISGKVTQAITIHGVELSADDTFWLHENGYIAEIYNEWGMSRWDDKGYHLGHKQLLRNE